MALSTMRNKPADIHKEVAKQSAELREKAPRILVCGNSGDGKSSLIRIAFGLKPNDPKAPQVHHGKPCTERFTEYPATDECPVHIVDSKGWELEVKGKNIIISSTKKWLDEMRLQSSLLERVHCVWYLVSNARCKTADRDLIGEYFKDMPVIVLISKCDVLSAEQVAAMTTEITSWNLPNIKYVLPVAASPIGEPVPPENCPKCDKDDISASMKHKTWVCGACKESGEFRPPRPRGVDTLIKQYTHALLPEMCRKSLLYAQVADVKSKLLFGIGIVTAATVAAAAVPWNPFPLSDAPVLSAIQVGMVASLAVLYGFRSVVIASHAAVQGLMVAGGITAASMLKVFFGPGTIVAALIESPIAAAFTLALGAAYLSIIHAVTLYVSKEALDDGDSVLSDVLAHTDVTALVNGFFQLFRRRKDTESVSSVVQQQASAFDVKKHISKGGK